MSKIMRALRAEHRKLWSKRSALSSIFLVGFIAVLVSLLCVGLRAGDANDVSDVLDNVHGYTGIAKTEKTSDWVGDMKRSVAAIIAERQELEERLPDASGVARGVIEQRCAELTRRELIGKYRLDNQLQPDGDSPWQVVVLAMWIMIPVIALISAVFASDMFAGEYERGTIRLIFSRPITRNRIYSAKVLLALMYTALLTAMAFVASALSATICFGDDVSTTYIGVLRGEVYQTSWLRYALTMLLCIYASVCVAVLFCAMIGNFARSRAAAVVAAVLLAVGGVTIGI